MFSRKNLLITFFVSGVFFTLSVVAALLCAFNGLINTAVALFCFAIFLCGPGVIISDVILSDRTCI